MSGFGCQEKNRQRIFNLPLRTALDLETCWSEAEIPSEAKRQRETLKPETSVFVIDDETELYVMNGETELNIEVRQSLETILPRQMVTCQVGLMPPVILLCSNQQGYPVQTSQMSPLIHEVNEKPGPQFTHVHFLLISTVS